VLLLVYLTTTEAGTADPSQALVAWVRYDGTRWGTFVYDPIGNFPRNVKTRMLVTTGPRFETELASEAGPELLERIGMTGLRDVSTEDSAALVMIAARRIITPEQARGSYNSDINLERGDLLAIIATTIHNDAN
jgi:hypothetical protein